MLKPLSNCVLIRQDIEKLSELIVLPQSKLFSGIIVAIGEGKKNPKGFTEPMNVKEGDHVYARTTVPITANNRIVIPVGSNVQGTIKDAARAGRVKGKASLTLSFQTIILPSGVTLDIYGSLGGSEAGTRECEATIKGDSSKGKDVGDIARAGVTGGILGAVIGGRKAGAVGAGAGAGAGLASVLLNRGADLELPKGTSLEVVLDQPLEF